MGGGSSATGGGSSATGGGSSATGGGGGATGGGSGATGGGSSATGGGTAAGGGGGFVDMGDGGPFHWGTLIADPMNTTIPILYAVRSFSFGDTWIVGRDSIYGAVVFYMDGGELAGLYAPNDGDDLPDIEMIRSPPRLAVAHGDRIIDCDRADGGCFNPNRWQPRVVGLPGDQVLGVCTDGHQFFGAGRSMSSDAVLFGTSRLATFTAQGDLYDCYVQPDGVVLGAGDGKLARYFPDGGSDLLPVQAPGFDGTPIRWLAIHGVADHIFLAGDAKAIVELMPDGGFEKRYEPSGTVGNFRAMAGLFPNELFAAGDVQDDDHAARFDGNTWSITNSFAPLVNVYGMHAVNANAYFAVGQELNSMGGIVGGQIIYGWR
jgi:hypothetical protein